MSKLDRKVFMRDARKKRIVNKFGKYSEKPRLSVFRSSKNIYAQVIDDIKGVTLVSASTLDPDVRAQVAELREAWKTERESFYAPAKADAAEEKQDQGQNKKKKGKKAAQPEPQAVKKVKKETPNTINVRISRLIGEVVAKRCLEKNISQVKFDRNGYKYHGRVKTLADSARKAGLQF